MSYLYHFLIKLFPSDFDNLVPEEGFKQSEARRYLDFAPGISNHDNRPVSAMMIRLGSYEKGSGNRRR